MTASPTLTPREAERLIRGFADHEKFCSHLQIRNKDGVAIPYKSSPGGRKLDAAIRKQEAAGVPVRIVCLKASQVWMSSSTATQIFRRTPFFPGRRALVLADIEKHTDLVFEYYEQYIKSYADNPYGAEFDSAILLPELIKDTDQHLRWANGSSILCGTARNVDIARSAPFNWVQLSEAAFYRSLNALMTGLMQRVPMSRDSGVIIESTANGEGNDFANLWDLALSGKSGWLAVFLAYWEHPENVADVSLLGYKDPGAFQKSLSRDEWKEQQQYNLTLEQLAWRRHKIETDCEGKIDRFRQEHPGNPAEAFLHSGRTIFDLAALARMPIVQEPSRGELQLVDVGLEKRVQFVEKQRGELAIYSLPQKGRHYIIGVDHAQGIDPRAKEGRSDPDYCSATVCDADTGEQVAKLRERYEVSPWAERVYWLGKFYNWAYLVPERKALGAAVIGRLFELQYPMEMIYSAEREPSDRRPPLAQEYGYETTVVLRAVLISALDNAIRSMSIRLHDAHQITECRQFVRKPNGREEGTNHDDDVFSAAFVAVGMAKAQRAFAYRDALTKATALSKPQSYRKQTRDEDDD